MVYFNTVPHIFFVMSVLDVELVDVDYITTFSVMVFRHYLVDPYHCLAFMIWSCQLLTRVVQHDANYNIFLHC